MNRKDLNIGIISQARMTSTRLPGKVMMEVKGKPLLYYHYKRLSKSGLPIYLATTTNSSDDVLCDYADKSNIVYCRGSEDDVLSRYYECAKKNNLNVIIRVTSDCPLIDGELINKGLNKYLEKYTDDVYLGNGLNRTFPRGFDFEIFSFELLEKANQFATEKFEREHVTPWIYHTQKEKNNLISFEDENDNSDIRITVDTKEDFELIKILIEEFNVEKLSGKDIVNIIRKNNKLLLINSSVSQKKI